MELEAGKIYSGKVIGIAKFGAFVQIAPGRSGLVHISEISNSYVKSVEDFLSVGQEVKVKLLNVDENGRINLSISKAVPQEERTPRPVQRQNTPIQPRQNQQPIRSQKPVISGAPEDAATLTSSGDENFEMKLRQFMQSSDSRMSSNKLYANYRSGSRRGSGKKK